MSKTRQIRIDFRSPVNLPDGFQRRLADLLTDVTEAYEALHPGRVMWVFGMGDLMISGMWDDNLQFDDGILHIEIAEREDLHATDRRVVVRTHTIVEEVFAERRRQVEKEGYSARHDDGHPGEMASAAAAYALCAAESIPMAPAQEGRDFHSMPPRFWPWEGPAFKPKGPRRDLIRAAALIVAEIERIDRTAGMAEAAHG